MTKRRRKICTWLGALLVLLVAVRLIMPTVLLRALNEKLGKLEGPLCAHMGDLDLALIKGMYKAQDLTVARWSASRDRCESVVLRVGSMNVSLSWSQLLRGRARLDVEGHGVDLFYDDLMNALREHKPGDAQKDAARQTKQASEILVPWRVDSLLLSEGRVQMALLGAKDTAVSLDHVEGMITGIEQGRQAATPTMFRIKANIFDTARLLATGSVNLSGEPALWDVDYGMERMDLTHANPLLLNRAPISFTSGLMDIYGEAAGGGKEMKGYTKLLFRDVDVVADREKFKNVKHGLIEVLGSLFFIVAKSPKRQTAGTIINFGTEGGELKVDIAGSISSALAHRSGSRPVTPGIENRLSLPSRNKDSARADAGSERSL